MKDLPLKILDSTEGHAVPEVPEDNNSRIIHVDVFEPNPIAFVAAESGDLPWGASAGFSPVISFEPGFEGTPPQITVLIVDPASGSTAVLGGDIFITNAVSCDVAAASCIFNAPAISVSGGETVTSNLMIGISVAASALSVISATETGITLSLNTAALDAIGYQQDPNANVFALQPTAAPIGLDGTVSVIAEGTVAVVNIIAVSQVAADGEDIYIKAPDYGADYVILTAGTPLDADSECRVQTDNQADPLAGGTPVREGGFLVSICRLPASAGTPDGDDIQLPFTVSVIFDFSIEEAEELTLALANANEIPRSLYPADSPPYPYAPVTGSGSEYALTFSNTAFDIGFQLVGDASQSGTLLEGQTGTYRIGPLSPDAADLASLEGTISVFVTRLGSARFDAPPDVVFAPESCDAIVPADLNDIPGSTQVSCLVDFDPAIGAAEFDIRAGSDPDEIAEDRHFVQIQTNANFPGYTVPNTYPADDTLNPQIITVDIIEGAVYRLRASSLGTSTSNANNRLAVNWGNLVTVSVLFEPAIVQPTPVTLTFLATGELQRDTAFSVVTPDGTEESVFTLICPDDAGPFDACFLRANLAASAGSPVSSAALTLSLNAEAVGQNIVFTIENLDLVGSVIPDSAADRIEIGVLTPQAELARADYGADRAEGEAFISTANRSPLEVILSSVAVEDITIGFRATGSQCIGCDAAITAYGDFDILTDTAGECFPLADVRNVWTTGGINAPNDGICSVVIPQGQIGITVTVTVAADFALQDSLSEPVNFQLLPITPPYYDVNTASVRWAVNINDRPFEIPGFRLPTNDGTPLTPLTAIINVAGDTDRNADFTVHYPGGLGNQPDNTLADAYRLETEQADVEIRIGATPQIDAEPTVGGVQVAVSLVGGGNAAVSEEFTFRPPAGITPLAYQTATVTLTINGSIARDLLTAADDDVLFRVLPEGSEVGEAQLVQIFPPQGRAANHIFVGEVASVRIFFPGANFGLGSAGEITISIGADTGQLSHVVGSGGVTCNSATTQCTLAASAVSGEASDPIAFRINSADGGPVTLALVDGNIPIPGFTASDETIVMEVRPPEVSFEVEAGQFQNEGGIGVASADAILSVTFNPAAVGNPATVYLQIPSDTGFRTPALQAAGLTDWDFVRNDVTDAYIDINSCDTFGCG